MQKIICAGDANIIYSVDLTVHFCRPEDKNKSHNLKTFTLCRKDYFACKELAEYLGIEEIRFGKREKKPNWYESKYYNGNLPMIDCCFLDIYYFK